MPDFRCFCDSPPAGDVLELSAEESAHLVAANRARVGDPAVAFDGGGQEWQTRVLEAHKRRAKLAIESCRRIAPPTTSIALAQALPKGKLMESIARRTTEIGVQALWPLVTERVVSRPDEARLGVKDHKWRLSAIEGAKQSGNPFLPEIEPVAGLDAFLADAARYELKLIASLRPGAASIKRQVQAFRDANEGSAPRSAVWLVGPEGDFSERETDAALAAGFLPVTLGPYVLRCETAAVAALSILRSELADA